MTHDALLDIIEHWNWIEPKTLIKAFRVVVELHKPFHPEFGGGIDYCFADNFAYPCPTIQAIEKELS